MDLSVIQEKVKEATKYCVFDFLNNYNIKLVYDSQMDKTKMDSMLKILNNQSIIFMKTNLDETYKTFLIYHELGHYLLHYEKDMKYSFYLSRYKNRLELEANTFACLCLLENESCIDINIIELLNNKGVPNKLALQFYNYIQG